MNIEITLKFIDSVAKLLGVLAWPAITVFVLHRFGSEIGKFAANMAEFSLKGFGFEATVRRSATEATAALVAAEASRPSTGPKAEPLKSSARKTAELVSGLVTQSMIRRTRNSTVLWVDDQPLNNIFERQSLEALGITFVLAASTEEALSKLTRESFSAIISDMGRPPDTQAGYTLLEKIRVNGSHIPFIIYSGSRDPEHQAEARRRGAVGCTNTPNELFKMVLTALELESPD